MSLIIYSCEDDALLMPQIEEECVGSYCNLSLPNSKNDLFAFNQNVLVWKDSIIILSNIFNNFHFSFSMGNSLASLSIYIYDENGLPSRSFNNNRKQSIQETTGVSTNDNGRAYFENLKLENTHKSSLSDMKILIKKL